MRDINGNSNTINVVEGDTNNRIDGIGNIVYGTQIINNPTQKQDEIKYNIQHGKLRLNYKVLTIAGSSFSLVGLIGFISSILTIINSFKDSKISEPNYYILAFILLLVLGIMIMLYSSQLKKKRIVSFFSKFIFGFQLGLYKDGTIGRLKLVSNCPKEKCGGNLMFFYNEKEDKYYFVCSRNSTQHRFEFDFTELEY